MRRLPSRCSSSSGTMSLGAIASYFFMLMPGAGARSATNAGLLSSCHFLLFLFLRFLSSPGHFPVRFGVPARGR